MLIKSEFNQLYEEKISLFHEDKYVGLLKSMIESHCKMMQGRLSRFPQKVIKDIPKLNIPDGEVMSYGGQELKLKAKALDATLVYDKLSSQAKISNYNTFIKNYKAASRGKSPELTKAIFNDFQAQLVKDFAEQKENLYETVAVLNAVMKWLKKDNKEKIKKNSRIDKEETATPTSDLATDGISADSSDVEASSRDDQSDAEITPVESAHLDDHEKWMEPFMESSIESAGSFEPDFL